MTSGRTPPYLGPTLFTERRRGTGCALLSHSSAGDRRS